MVARTLRAEARKSALGSAVRIIGIARAMVAISLANLAYNTKRIFWLSGGPALA